MNYLPIILIILLIISIGLNLLYLNIDSSSMHIVNQMGIGYNLGNIFDCYNNTIKILNPDEQIKLCGNEPPTKQMIKNIKKCGFKTIRLPVTWINFIDELGNINSNWMSKIKEVVDWIINLNMFCILNIYHDGESGNWLSEGLKSKNKYINLWKQIAEEFKMYDELLIFESMNKLDYISENNNNYRNILLSLNQAFVDVVRNSGINNKKRLLLICDSNKDNLSYLLNYKMPNDPYNKLALALHYYFPLQFTKESDDNPWQYIVPGEYVYTIEPLITWGSENDYKDIISDFELLKKIYINKEIPVIIVEIGVLTEQKKEIESIR